jgi:hypothetical protein
MLGCVTGGAGYGQQSFLAHFGLGVSDAGWCANSYWILLRWFRSAVVALGKVVVASFVQFLRSVRVVPEGSVRDSYLVSTLG